MKVKLRLLAMLVVIATSAGTLLAQAAEQVAVVVEPTIIEQIREALGGLILLVISVVTVFVAKALPGLLEALKVWLVERATSERVRRIDEAIDVAVEAGETPTMVAERVAHKLPQTLQRSGKDKSEIVAEAITRKAAKQNAVHK